MRSLLTPHVRPAVVRKSDVTAVTGLSLPTIDRLEKEGKFPKRRRLSDSTSGWLYAEIEAWAAGLPISDLGMRGEATRLARQAERAALARAAKTRRG